MPAGHRGGRRRTTGTRWRRRADSWATARGSETCICAGSVGTGKTRLACTVLNEAWHTEEWAVAFARVPRLLYQLQPHAVVETAETFEQLTAARLLVLDDLGAERDAATDYTRRTLLMLYEARHDAGRRTVWTSNKRPSAIGAFMGDDRLASRITGRCRVVELEGRDWRLPGHGPSHTPPRGERASA